MSRSPWEDKLYETSTYRSQRHQTGNLINSIFFILFIIFAVIALFMIFMSIYLSTGGSQNESVSTSFFDQANTPAPGPEPVPSETPPSESSAEEGTEETASSSTGSTLTVQPGEGANSIAARAGISLERLYELNPQNMTNGYWYANPGDVVNID